MMMVMMVIDDDDDGDVPFQSRPFSIHVTMRPCVHAFPSSPATARRLTSPGRVGLTNFEALTSHGQAAGPPLLARS